MVARRTGDRTPSGGAAPAGSRRSRGAPWWGLGVGVLGALVGLVPHLLSGARLPVQNLWARPDPLHPPIALLPVGQYAIWTIIAMFVAGGTLCAFAQRANRRAYPAWAVALGLLGVQAAVITQSFLVLAHGLALTDPGADGRAATYFWLMLGVCVLGAVLGQVAFWLLTRRSAAVAGFGLALAATPLTQWVVAVITAVITEFTMPYAVLLLARWLPVVIVAAGLVWCGARPARRLVVWLVAPVSLLLVPALAAAGVFVAGSRALWADPSAILGAAVDAFVLNVMSVGAIVGVVLAVLAGVVGTLIRSSIERARAERDAAAVR